MTALVWIAGLFVGYRVLRIVARITLAPLARMWRERPVVIWSEERKKWEAAERLSRFR